MSLSDTRQSGGDKSVGERNGSLGVVEGELSLDLEGLGLGDGVGAGEGRFHCSALSTVIASRRIDGGSVRGN